MKVIIEVKSIETKPLPSSLRRAMLEVLKSAVATAKEEARLVPGVVAVEVFEGAPGDFQ